MHAFLEILDRRLTQNKFFCQVGKVTKTVSQIRIWILLHPFKNKKCEYESNCVYPEE